VIDISKIKMIAAGNEIEFIPKIAIVAMEYHLQRQLEDSQHSGNCEVTGENVTYPHFVGHEELLSKGVSAVEACFKEAVLEVYGANRRNATGSSRAYSAECQASG
jgi:hypothetical protein